MHLRHGRDKGPVRSLVASQEVIREEASLSGLWDPQRECPHARGGLALPVAVPAVAFSAHLVGLGVHNLVCDGLGELAQELPRVDRAVLEPRQKSGSHLRHEWCLW